MAVAAWHMAARVLITQQLLSLPTTVATTRTTSRRSPFLEGHHFARGAT